MAQIYAESSWIFHPDPSGSKPLEKRPRHWEQSLQEFTVPVACGLLCFLLCFLRMDNWGLRQPLVYVSNKSRWTPQRFLSKVMDRFVSIEPGPEFSANRFGICSWNLQDSVTDAEWCLIVYNLPTKVAQAFKSLPSPDHRASPKITQMFEVHKVHVNWNLAAYRPIRPRTSQISPMLPMCFYFWAIASPFCWSKQLQPIWILYDIFVQSSLELLAALPNYGQWLRFPCCGDSHFSSESWATVHAFRLNCFRKLILKTPWKKTWPCCAPKCGFPLFDVVWLSSHGSSMDGPSRRFHRNWASQLLGLGPTHRRHRQFFASPCDARTPNTRRPAGLCGFSLGISGSFDIVVTSFKFSQVSDPDISWFLTFLILTCSNPRIKNMYSRSSYPTHLRLITTWSKNGLQHLFQEDHGWPMWWDHHPRWDGQETRGWKPPSGG